jgi:hypothetical protein
MNLSAFLFPNEDPKSFGSLGSVGAIGSKIISQFDHKRLKLFRSKLHSVLAPASINVTPILNQKIDAVSKSMCEYYGATGLEPVQSKILQEYLKENLLFDRMNRKFDRFAGNSLVPIAISNDFPSSIAMARGELMNELFVYNFASDTQIWIPNDVQGHLRFSTPIQQISIQNQGLVVRSMQGIHFVDNNYMEYSTIEFGTQPMHLAPNPKLKNDAAIVLGNGEIHLWDFQYSRLQMNNVGTLNVYQALNQWTMMTDVITGLVNTVRTLVP